jgi:inosose dehydratase
MSSSWSRRKFFAGITTTFALSSLTDLIADQKSSNNPALSPISFGYHAITWRGEDQQAIKDISELGFKGIQLRSNIVSKYSNKPEELREILKKWQLEFVALSSGDATGKGEAEEIAKHVAHAKFVKSCNGRYLQITDKFRPKSGKPQAEDFKSLGRLLNEIGKRTNDLGIPLAYHNHMDSLGESPEEIDRIMDVTDPRYVRFLLDVAHYTQGGGDPVAAVKRYKDRITFLHIKDVRPQSATAQERKRPYKFVELGNGRVRLPEVFAALKEVNYKGWAIVELDDVTEKDRSPRESAMISKRYILEKLGLSL